MKYIIICLLFISCGPRIVQDVEQCGNGNQFQVRTHVYRELPRRDLYSLGTWGEMGFKCLEASQVDSAKKAGYKKAQDWIEEFNKIK